MNEKITLQELADLFARKSQLEQADAEQFVKAFLSLVEEALARDKYVKVKGLGVFKLINVEARKSVDVNTGEAIEIQGHARVSFIPEVGLRDLVNKPFAHFQSVLLKEDVHFEDIPEGETQPGGDELDLNETDFRRRLMQSGLNRSRTTLENRKRKHRKRQKSGNMCCRRKRNCRWLHRLLKIQNLRNKLRLRQKQRKRHRFRR